MRTRSFLPTDKDSWSGGFYELALELGNYSDEYDGKKFLTSDDVFGGQINIIYQGEETFLAMEKDRQILSI